MKPEIMKLLLENRGEPRDGVWAVIGWLWPQKHRQQKQNPTGGGGQCGAAAGDAGIPVRVLASGLSASLQTQRPADGPRKGAGDSIDSGPGTREGSRMELQAPG